MKQYTTARVSIGKAADWQIHADFDQRAFAMECVVVTGEGPGDMDPTRALGDMTMLNPAKTLRKMAPRLKKKGKFDDWHKANTPGNSVCFARQLRLLTCSLS